MKQNLHYLIIGVAIIAAAWLLGRAYTYKYRSQDTIVVTGLGETEFSSDLIVWSGQITFETYDVSAGYTQLEKNKDQVLKFVKSHGLDSDDIVFKFVNVEKLYTSRYSDNGNYIGQYFAGYRLSQEFLIESSEVDKVEAVSREISSLIAQGITIDTYSPDYYYTKLEDVKLSLIERASADAKARAEKIAENAGTALGKVASARMGVFQITGANSNEEFSAGGSFNTSSRHKKARITMRVEYRVK